MTTSPIILPIDGMNPDRAEKLIDELQGLIGYIKIGLGFFSRYPGKVRHLFEFAKRRNIGGFVDLKIHDIPNTAREAVRAHGDQGVDFTTIHLLGGGEMISAAVDEARSFPNLTVLGVTILTSHNNDSLKKIGIKTETVEEQVILLAKLGTALGVKGLVCSPKEVRPLRERFRFWDLEGDNIQLVTPGIRFPDSPPDDQARTATPREAIEAGSNKLVIGRPITGASDPRFAAERILADISAVQ